MKVPIFHTLIFSCLFCIGLQAQEDPVLFTVGNQDVPVSEFEYIFKKNNSDGLDASLQEVKDYLDLYINFKLKVQRAKELKIDTINTLNEELEGYRQQLAKSYLMNKEVVSKLVAELFERKQYDINISHLVVEIPADATEKEVENAYQEALKYRKMLKESESFSKVARQHSDDPAVNENGGNIGYVNAPLPEGFYHFETAAYETEVGDFSMPVRSPMGFHILKVNDKRDARGEYELAHILIRKATDGSGPTPEEKTQLVLDRLEKGESFEKLAGEMSEDAATSQRGGYVGFVGINLFERSFEDAAFSIPEDGAYSEPIETRVGYHIIKRISRRPLEDPELMRPLILAQIEKSDRKEIAMKELIQRIKEEANYSFQESVLDSFIAELDDEIFSYRWQVPENLDDQALFSLGNKEVMLSEFAEHLRRNTRQRLRMSREMDIAEAVHQIYHDFVGDKAISFQESRLENKYPEFRALMREYEEGILLFEITKKKVWDRASNDTVGLRQFYEAHQHQYKSEEMAEVTIFKVSGANDRRLNRIHEFAADHSAEELNKRFHGKRNVEIETERQKIRKSNLPEDLKFEEGFTTEISQDENGKHLFSKVSKILPSKPKPLEEARGFVIADYQDKLEKEWMEELKDRFEVTINRNVLDRMYKSWQ